MELYPAFKIFTFWGEFVFVFIACIQLLKTILPHFISASVTPEQKSRCICKFMQIKIQKVIGNQDPFMLPSPDWSSSYILVVNLDNFQVSAFNNEGY